MPGGKVYPVSPGPCHTACPEHLDHADRAAARSFTTVVVVSALLLPLNYWLGAWVGGLTVYYMLSVPGEPEHNGVPRQHHLQCKNQL